MSRGFTAASRSCTGRSWRPARRSRISSQTKRGEVSTETSSVAAAHEASSSSTGPAAGRAAPGAAAASASRPAARSSAAASPGNHGASRNRQAASARSSASRRRAASSAATGSRAPGQRDVGRPELRGGGARGAGDQPERHVGDVGGGPVAEGGAEPLRRHPEALRRRPGRAEAVVEQHRPVPVRVPRGRRQGDDERPGVAHRMGEEPALVDRRPGQHRHPLGAGAQPHQPERRVHVADRHVVAVQAVEARPRCSASPGSASPRSTSSGAKTSPKTVKRSRGSSAATAAVRAGGPARTT